MDTVTSILDAGDPSDPALSTIDGAWLDHAGLRTEIERLAGQLRAAGIGPDDRVAIVLPNGPEMALAFLAAATAGCAAPLNPKYREDEFRFYLDDLGARALLTLEGGAEAAHAAAPEGIVAIAVRGDGIAIDFSSDGSDRSTRQRPAGDNEALVLHTSGTTSRPKIVPLRQHNLTTSAHNIATSLALTSDDRSLNVMPLFHIHGLMAGLLAPLAAGGSVVCTPGFDAFKFHGWLERHRPTYYNRRTDDAPDGSGSGARATAEQPSIRALVVGFASRTGSGGDRIALRGPGRRGLWNDGGHPSDDMQSPAAGGRQADFGRSGHGHRGRGSRRCRPTRGRRRRGEVAIRGETVVDGYEHNPAANEAAFTAGWFRTGDEGVLDDDGYLFLTGRLKEQINRGGEKISPLEIDDVLLRHPAVGRAVAFAMPHPKLGEEVAAAVVLQDGAEASERELRDHVSRHLASFKVPRLVVFLDEIPKGATGKLQRIGLADKLGLV